MINRHTQPKFFRNAYRSQNIVCSVGMCLYWDFSLQHRQPAFITEVRYLLRITLPFLLIFLCFRQFFPQHCRNGHAGCRGIPLTGIIHFRVFSKSNLHGSRSLHDHPVNASPMGFQKSKLSTHDISASRTYHGRRNPCLQCIMKSSVHRIDGIYGPQIRGNRINILITVISLHPFLLFRNAHMAMRLNDTRHDQIAFCINNLNVLPAF